MKCSGLLLIFVVVVLLLLSLQRFSTFCFNPICLALAHIFHLAECFPLFAHSTSPSNLKQQVVIISKKEKKKWFCYLPLRWCDCEYDWNGPEYKKKGDYVLNGITIHVQQLIMDFGQCNCAYDNHVIQLMFHSAKLTIYFVYSSTFHQFVIRSHFTASHWVNWPHRFEHSFVDFVVVGRKNRHFEILLIEFQRKLFQNGFPFLKTIHSNRCLGQSISSGNATMAFLPFAYDLSLHFCSSYLRFSSLSIVICVLLWQPISRSH